MVAIGNQAVAIEVAGSRCKRIVSMMGGQIWVEDHEGPGSTFRFTVAMELRSSSQKAVSSVAHQEKVEEEEAKASIGGARILLVEDNPINMQVARELLEQVGVFVGEANHGGKALHMLQSGHYDAVLMDLQMPEVDGFTATRLIRSNKQFQSLPIIAMTAHAMGEDKQKCLAAGMNDHVAKPFDLTELYNTLKKWVHLELLPAFTQPMGTGKVELCLPHLPGLDTVAGLARLVGNTALYRKLLCQFQEEHAQDAQKIALALEKKKLRQAERLAHTLKSASGQLGARELQQSAAALEDGICQEDPKVDLLLQALESALAKVMGSLAKLETPSPAPVKAEILGARMDPEQLAVLLKDLMALLQEQDSKADTLVEPIRIQLQDHAAETVLNQLENQLKHYDHEGALESLLEMAGKVGVLLE